MRWPTWFPFRSQTPEDPDVQVQHLASGTVSVGIDLPRGVLLSAKLLPDADANGTRLRILARPDLADRLGDLLGEAAKGLRR